MTFGIVPLHEQVVGDVLVSGRLFTEHDPRDTPRVTIVDERMAQDLWPGEDPIGKRIRTGGLNSTTPWITVIGVAGRVKQYTLDSEGFVPAVRAARIDPLISLRSE